jgi:hypothetical protein
MLNMIQKATHLKYVGNFYDLRVAIRLASEGNKVFNMLEIRLL